MSVRPTIFSICLTFTSTITGNIQATAQPLTEPNSIQPPIIEEVLVWGKASSSQQAGYTNPTSVLTQADFATINVATTEDLVKYEPSLIIRRRYIGDSNGTMGMRGSNMFQTSRSMVFADGVPLHYFLQSRFNGAPRWTLVSASEIAQVEVVYGPFSAEYSGNAMGGVVNIETAIPQEQEFHIDTAYFSQDFSAYGFDDTVSGYKTFMSYGDKVGNWGIYGSYNRLENDAQPQSYYSGGSTSSATLTLVTGAIAENDELGQPQLFFGDTGIEESTTNNYKLKIGYEFADWQALVNIAYEDRNNQNDSPNSYLQDSNGNSIYSGNVIQNGRAISVPSSRLNISELNRDSLSVGLRLRGELSEKLELEANISDFSILRDETRSSARNPNDPAFDLSGQVRDFGDTGWQTAEVKLTADITGIGGMTWVNGLRYEAYKLNLDVYSSNNFAAGSKDAFTSRSGGETDIVAAYSQINWTVNSNWDLAFGARFESWHSNNGYFSNDDSLTPQFETERVPNRDDQQISPKFSLAFHPNEDWTLRYSVAKAYRFPIVEELFSQYDAYNALNLANPELKPENGLHHNVMVERSLAQGYWRINIYQEAIKDVIENQSQDLPGGLRVRTFVPIDEIETKGVEFVLNAFDVLIDNLDLRFNLAYTDSKIIRNDADPSIEGNFYPRMPEWRGNVLVNYRISDAWDVGVSLQYASDSFGRTDNADTEDNVFSAQDPYTRVGVKSNYKVNQQLSLAFGVDNITDEIAYVAHPWPARTVYINAAYDF